MQQPSRAQKRARSARVWESDPSTETGQLPQVDCDQGSRENRPQHTNRGSLVRIPPPPCTDNLDKAPSRRERRAPAPSCVRESSSDMLTWDINGVGNVPIGHLLWRAHIKDASSPASDQRLHVFIGDVVTYINHRNKPTVTTSPLCERSMPLP